MSVIYDEEDGKQVAVNFAPGDTGKVVLTMKDGSVHTLSVDLARAGLVLQRKAALINSQPCHSMTSATLTVRRLSG